MRTTCPRVFSTSSAGEVCPLFLFMSIGVIIMFKIILRDQSYTREYGSDNAIDALVLFDILTKTYLHVEMWQGGNLIQQYKNC
jgi:hypothetical protein